MNIFKSKAISYDKYSKNISIEQTNKSLYTYNGSELIANLMKVKRTAILLLLLSFTSYLQVSAQVLRTPPDLGYNRMIGFPVGPPQAVIGVAAGQGQMEFAMRDSVRDVFINPAKMYRQNDSYFIFSPSVTLFYDNQTAVDELNNVSSNNDTKIERNSRFRTYSLPIGFNVKSNRFYGGGFISLYNNKEVSSQTTQPSGMVRVNSGRTFRGTPYHLYAGWFLTSRSQLGISFQNENRESEFDPSENSNLIADQDFNRSFRTIKLGYGLSTDRGEWFMQAGLQRNESETIRKEASSTSTFNEELDVRFVRIEYTHLLDSDFKISSRFTINQLGGSSSSSSSIPFIFSSDRDFGNHFAMQISGGIFKKFEPVELAAEIDYEYANKNAQSDGATGFTRNLWRVRTGFSLPLSNKLRLRGGFVSTYYSDNTEVLISRDEQNLTISEEGFFQRTFHRLTTGLTYRLQNVTMTYSLNRVLNSSGLTTFGSNSFPRTFVYQPFINHFTLRYHF